MPYHLLPSIRAAVGRSIFITGVARSGTTMMGSLVHSLKSVEYAFEPPFLCGLLPCIDQIPQEVWCLLYETYLFEDLHIDAVAGRRLNFNENEDSCVFRAKSKDEILVRLVKGRGRKELFPLALEHRIPFKSPDVLPFVPRLHGYYPQTQVLVMYRSPERVLLSILRKGWVSDVGLSGLTAIWPSRSDLDPVVPFWVSDEDVKWWREMREVERAHYYYLRMYESVVGQNSWLIIDYDAFVASPAESFSRIATGLGCEYGSKTGNLLHHVAEPEKKGELSLEECDLGLRRRVRDISEQVRAMACQQL